jgi:hypothetical protein
VRVYKSFYGWVQPYDPKRHDEMLTLRKGYVVEATDGWLERQKTMEKQWNALWDEFRAFPVCPVKLHTTVAIDGPDPKYPHPRQDDGEGIVLDGAM